MPISGQFSASPNYVGYRQPDNARNWGEGVDPRHADRMQPDPGTPPPAPIARLEIPPFIEDQVDISRMPPAWPDADTETAPYDDPRQHEPQTLPWGVPDGERLRALSGRLHSMRRRVPPDRMATMVARDFTTRNATLREQSLPPSAAAQGGPISGQALRALRGRNSLPVNNPGDPEVSFSGNYVRQGWEISRVTQRRMPRRGISHTKRELHLNLAAVALDSPGTPGPYSSPYSAYARLNVGAMRPAARREPRPWDEDAVTDYGDAGAEPMTSWGL